MYAILNIIAAAGSTQSGEGGSALGMFLPLIIIFLIMWLLIFRPQAKKQKKHQQMLQAVKKGDKILTAGGIYGTVNGFKENESIIILKVDDGCKVDLLKSSIAQNITAEERNKAAQGKK
ncbi:MAG: preprotein translocase subunit YajC [candidate division KSB1 bacterium]|nr:preprotein translocase subunit YajC [candidate division KSB1 bacterium]